MAGLLTSSQDTLTPGMEYLRTLSQVSNFFGMEQAVANASLQNSEEWVGAKHASIGYLAMGLQSL